MKVPGVTYPQTDPQKVQLLYQDPPRIYEVVGFVAVDVGVGVGQDRVEQAFQAKGSKLGADAVVIEALPLNTAFKQVQGKGKAIRWKQ